MKFLIIGAGQTGRLVAEIVERIPDLECVGYLDRDPAHQGRTYMGLPVLGSDENLESFAGQVEGALPVVGDLTARLRLFARCRAAGFELVSVVDPSVVAASDLKAGDALLVSFNTSILTGVELGDYAFIGTGVNILHDTKIGSNCVIGGGSTIGAMVTVGDNVSFGTGVTVASRKIRIGNNAQIAAGSVILKDVPDNAFVLGNPARVIGRTPTVESVEPVAGPLQDVEEGSDGSIWDAILGRSSHLESPCILGGEPLSQGEFLEAVDLVARKLTDAGCAAGSRVAISLDQGPAYTASLVAVRKVGAIAVLLGPDWTDHEKERVLEHSEARWALTDMPVLVREDPVRCHTIEGMDCVLHEYDRDEKTPTEPADAVLIYTSGTTGVPKGVMLTESGVSANVRAVAAYLGMQRGDSAPIFTPTCYAYSLSQNLVALWAGAAILPMPSGLMFPAEVLQAVAQHGLTGLSATPTAFRILSQLDVGVDLDLGSVRYVMSGGQPLSVRLIDNLSSLFPRATIVNMYGCTENSPRISYHRIDGRAGMDENGFFAVGKAVNGTELRVEVEPGQEATPGQSGEVVIRGSSFMRGYWRDDEATRERVVDGWFRTRDLGYLDEGGGLHLVGRESTIINIGNEKVSPEEVEQVLCTAPGVEKAAVYGVPDPLLGESVQALVVPVAGQEPQIADLQRHCRGKISGYKTPRRIRLVDSIPETLYGKIDRKKLKEPAS